MAQPTQGHLNPEDQPPGFIEYDLFHHPIQAGTSLHRANSLVTMTSKPSPLNLIFSKVPGPIESLENFTATSPPHLQGGEQNKFNYGVNQRPGSNLKQETDFFREDLNGSQYPFPNIPNPF
mgnify:FL=1